MSHGNGCRLCAGTWREVAEHRRRVMRRYEAENDRKWRGDRHETGALGEAIFAHEFWDYLTPFSRTMPFGRAGEGDGGVDFWLVTHHRVDVKAKPESEKFRDLLINRKRGKDGRWVPLRASAYVLTWVDVASESGRVVGWVRRLEAEESGVWETSARGAPLPSPMTMIPHIALRPASSLIERVRELEREAAS